MKAESDSGLVCLAFNAKHNNSEKRSFYNRRTENPYTWIRVDIMIVTTHHTS